MLDKILGAIPKVLSWIQIFISPFLIGVILGGVTFLYFNNTAGVIGGSTIVVLGVILGVWFAEKARKKYGTNEFMTRNSSTTANNFKVKK